MVRFLRIKDIAKTGLYSSYLRLKHDVFVKELGWPLPGSEKTGCEAEAHDSVGRFALAVANENLVVGAVRCVRMAGSFPQREYLEHHLIQNKLDSCWVMNSLIVAPSWRGQQYKKKCAAKRTMGSKLISVIVSFIAEEQASAVFVTTAPPPLVRFFIREGFFLIDGPFDYPGPSRKYVNLAKPIRCERFSGTFTEYLEGKHRSVLATHPEYGA